MNNPTTTIRAEYLNGQRDSYIRMARYFINQHRFALDFAPGDAPLYREHANTYIDLALNTDAQIYRGADIAELGLERNRIEDIEDQLDSHDCHASPEDGCDCVAFRGEEEEEEEEFDPAFDAEDLTLDSIRADVEIDQAHDMAEAVIDELGGEYDPTARVDIDEGVVHVSTRIVDIPVYEDTQTIIH